MKTFRTYDFTLAAQLLLRRARVVGQTKHYVDFDRLSAQLALIDLQLEHLGKVIEALTTTQKELSYAYTR